MYRGIKKLFSWHQCVFSYKYVHTRLVTHYDVNDSQLKVTDKIHVIHKIKGKVKYERGNVPYLTNGGGI